MPEERIEIDVRELRQRLAGTFPGEVGAEPVELDSRRAVGRLVVERRHLHPGGLVHGGVWVTLADSVAAWGTILNLAPGQTHTTIELKTNLFAPARLGDELVATAEPLHIGRRTQVWQTEVACGGRIAALFTATQMVLDGDG